MKKILLIISIFFFIPIKGICDEKFIILPYKPSGFNNERIITVKTICIDGYEYVLAMHIKGLGITQVMEIISDNKTAPKKCKK